MTTDNKRTIDEIASDIDDLTTTVEELETDSAPEVGTSEVKKLRHALEEASDAADAIDERLSNPAKDSSDKH